MKYKVILATVLGFVAVSSKITRSTIQTASTRNEESSKSLCIAVRDGVGNGSADARAGSNALTINDITQYKE